MLCGYPPFYGDNDDEILQKVILGDYQMEGEEWDQVSDDAKDLIKKTICFDSRNRINAEQALKHQWFQSFYNNKSAKCVDLNNSINRLKKFRVNYSFIF